MFPSVSFFPELFESQLVGPVAPLLDLEADTGVTVSNVDKVDIWADQSGNGYNFTQTGAARPALATVSGYPCLQFDSVDDWMLGQNWVALNNMNSATIIVVQASWSNGTALITKANNDSCNDSAVGWICSYGGLNVVSTYGPGQNRLSQYTNSYLWDTLAVASFELVSRSELYIYINGVLDCYFPSGEIRGAGPIDYSTSEPVRIGIDGAAGACDSFGSGFLYAIRIYSPALSSAQRSAVEQELANRYGITL